MNLDPAARIVAGFGLAPEQIPDNYCGWDFQSFLQVAGMSKKGVHDEKANWTDVAVAYQRVIRSFDEYVKPVLKRYRVPSLGLSNVLFLITIGDEPKRVADLVRQQRYAGSNASYAIAALEEYDLVGREYDPEDKRVRVVQLTPKGKRLLSAIKRATEGDEREIGAALETLSAFENRLTSLPAAE